VTEIKTAETTDAEKAESEEPRVGKTPDIVEETVNKSNQKDENEIVVVATVEETADSRQNDEIEKIGKEEIALKEVIDEMCPDVEYEAKPSEVVVFATATFDNSPHDVLIQDDFNSLEKILFSAKHLEENIVKLSAGGQTNRKFRSRLNKHTLELQIRINIEKLWESPRSYIWRNLGQDVWTRSNGTEVQLVRIHVQS
jgi:hypothetical protein